MCIRDSFLFEYSPESFTGTEVDYAVEVCNAVLGIMQDVYKRQHRHRERRAEPGGTGAPAAGNRRRQKAHQVRGLLDDLAGKLCACVVEALGQVRVVHQAGLVNLLFVFIRDRKSTRLNSSHEIPSRMPSSA